MPVPVIGMVAKCTINTAKPMGNGAKTWPPQYQNQLTHFSSYQNHSILAWTTGCHLRNPLLGVKIKQTAWYTMAVEYGLSTAIARSSEQTTWAVGSCKERSRTWAHDDYWVSRSNGNRHRTPSKRSEFLDCHIASQ